MAESEKPCEKTGKSTTKKQPAKTTGEPKPGKQTPLVEKTTKKTSKPKR